MNILTLKEINKLPGKFLYLPKLSVLDSNVVRLLEDCDKFEDLLPIINKINNQGISSIGSIAEVGYFYEVDGRKLGLQHMSTAELLFTVAFAATKLKRNVIVKYEVRQLENDVLQLFINTFCNGNESYVYVEVGNEEVKRYYECIAVNGGI